MFILTEEQKEDLLDYLDIECAVVVCDHSLKLTKQWIEENGLKEKEEEIIEYLEDNGGYCDCEVVLNVLDRD